MHPAPPTNVARAKLGEEHDVKELEYVHSTTQAPSIGGDEEAEPVFHARTWIALAAFFLLNYVQVVALQGPSSVLTYIGADLRDTEYETWIVVVLSLVQGVLGPIISRGSDIFQARKPLLVSTCTISFAGACIAPGSKSVFRLIGANVLIGVGFAAVPLAYAVPSEILPRRWRPLAQAMNNIAAVTATISGPFIIAALTQRNPHTGWRYFYWLQAALWGATALALLFGYREPKRRSDYSHLSVWRKLGHLDLIGCVLLTAGITLFITGTSLGGGAYSWTNARTLSTLIVGIVTLVAFFLYEWKGTSTGILHHDLFRGGRDEGRTFALCVLLLFLEAVMIFAFGLFFPILAKVLFTAEPILVVALLQPCWVATFISTIIWGSLSARFRTIREPLLAAFIIFTAGLIGLTTIQPGDLGAAIASSAILGLGFGGPLVLVITGVQLSTPHKWIATATACTTSARALAGAMFSTINATAFNTRLKNFLPSYVAKAALAAGLPAASVPAFILALSTGNATELAAVQGVEPAIIVQGLAALKQAYADSLRIVFIIAVPFGVVACFACWFLGDLRRTMNYHVDAPIEKQHAHIETDEKQERPPTNEKSEIEIR